MEEEERDNNSELLPIVNRFLCDLKRLKPMTCRGSRKNPFVTERNSKILMQASIKYRYKCILHDCVRHYRSLKKILSSPEAREYININQTNSDRETALHKAVNISYSFLFLLKQPGVNVRIKNDNGHTAFVKAMFTWWVTNETKSAIFEYIQTKDDKDKTLLKDMLNARDKTYGTVLTLLSDTEMMKYLIDEGIDVHVPNEDGICLLSKHLCHYHLSHFGDKLAKNKLSRKVDPSTIVLYGATCFQIAYNQAVELSKRKAAGSLIGKKAKFLKEWYKEKLMLIYLLYLFKARELIGRTFLPVDLVRITNEFIKL